MRRIIIHAGFHKTGTTSLQQTLRANRAALRPDTYETARLRYPGFDIYHVEGEWRDWSKGKEAPRDPDRAFLAFFKSFAEANPI